MRLRALWDRGWSWRSGGYGEVWKLTLGCGSVIELEGVRPDAFAGKWRMRAQVVNTGDMRI